VAVGKSRGELSKNNVEPCGTTQQGNAAGITSSTAGKPGRTARNGTVVGGRVVICLGNTRVRRVGVTGSAWNKP